MPAHMHLHGLTTPPLCAAGRNTPDLAVELIVARWTADLYICPPSIPSICSRIPVRVTQNLQKLTNEWY